MVPPSDVTINGIVWGIYPVLLTVISYVPFGSFNVAFPEASDFVESIFLMDIEHSGGLVYTIKSYFIISG